MNVLNFASSEIVLHRIRYQEAVASREAVQIKTRGIDSPRSRVIPAQQNSPQRQQKHQ